MSEQRDNRNVLTGAPGQPAPTNQPQQRNDDLEVPVETIPLPSNGLVYPPGHPLHGRDTIDILSMTTEQEDILTSQALSKKGTMLSVLIRSCLVDKSIDPADMIIGDRYAVLLAIRITGYGQHYVDNVACSECGFEAQRTFDMAQFPLKRLSIQPSLPGHNQFSFMLPKTQKRVDFKFMTGRDEEEMHVIEQRMKKAGMQSGNQNVTSSLIRSIVSVNGNTDGAFIAKFVKHMNAGDSLALRKYMGDNLPGIQFTQEQSCSNCGHVEEVDMPLGLGFLWPNAKR